MELNIGVLVARVESEGNSLNLVNLAQLLGLFPPEHCVRRCLQDCPQIEAKIAELEIETLPLEKCIAAARWAALQDSGVVSEIGDRIRSALQPSKAVPSARRLPPHMVRAPGVTRV